MDLTLETLPAFLPKGFSRTNTQQCSLVSYSNIETPPNPYTHAHIHPYPLQPGQKSLWGIKMNIKLFLKCRITSRIRGSNPRVKINGLAGQGHPTRDMARVSRVTRKVAGRVGSGQHAVGSGWVRRFSTRVGSRGFQNPAGRVGSGSGAKMS